ncbi:VQ motif-containing protein 31-like [Solanum dulcamara]|uniref:VQ motif-containing protein 31-like n=1 Tax=Solanum dulcamara TaxID=45834 RepID=UPI0024856617|nr:VQ motif-containing protein 31-like [Solanum dulcamara]
MEMTTIRTGLSKEMTTFVQADLACFREVVQRLTGTSECSDGNLKSAATTKTSKAQKQSISKLHRRQCQRPDIEITNSQFQPIIIPSPSTRPNKRASPSIEMINKVEEEKAIKERRFYLHHSPRSKHGNAAEPELLTLFPLISPR